MKIQTVKYIDPTTLLINGKHSVPWPTENWRGKFIQKWLDAGNTITPADPPPSPPTKTERVGRLDPVLLAFLKVYAQDQGITPQQLKAKIVAKL